MDDPILVSTFTGRTIDLRKFTESDILIEDVAHHLSNINRFCGAAKFPYSVAQHSVILSHIVPPTYQRAAFAHDFSEYVVGDMITPVKRQCPEYEALEEGIQKTIFRRFQIPWEHMAAIHPYDKALGHEEWLQLFDPSYKLTGLTLTEMNWRDAKAMFMDRYEELF